MQKIVINQCHGGFSISKAAAEFMAARGNAQAAAELAKGRSFYGYGFVLDKDGYDRKDPDLIAAVEALGKDASGNLASLKIVEVPDDVEWVIQEYDGAEWVAEKHRIWE